MTATSKAVTGGKISVAFTYVAASQVVIDTATAAAQYLYDLSGAEPAEFDVLTDQQKLDIIDAHLQDVIRNLAYTQHSLALQRAGADTAAIESPTKFI